MKSWQQMTKEQKQYSVLGGVVGAVALYALVTFGATPLMQRSEAGQKELKQLQEQLAQADQLLRRESVLREEYKRDSQTLAELINRALPPPDNPLSWAALRVYQAAQAVNLKVEALKVESLSVPWSLTPPPTAPGAEPSKARVYHFAPYGLQMGVQCSYNELVRLVRKLQEDPNLSISRLSITGQAGTPEVHAVTLVVMWPMWGAPTRPPLPTAGE